MSVTFDELSEEALRLARSHRPSVKKKPSKKRKEVQTEVKNLKQSIDEGINARLLASQQ